MAVALNREKKKIHPHKFTLWVGLGSIVMMFAGLTSAYIVKRSQAGWTSFELPTEFWISTGLIILSSVTMIMALRHFRERLMQRYRLLMGVTLLLGLLFTGFQYVGFLKMWNSGITLTATVSYSFLYVIVGLHALHVLGGVIALLVMLGGAFSRRVKSYSTVPVELINTYWHFVGALWIYLLIFLLMIK